ncbi:MAG: response regulator transcription factor [Pseudomonadota bacterium]
MMLKPIYRSIILYGLVLAAGAFALQWLEYRYTIQALSGSVYIVIIACAFALVGLWVGLRLTQPKQQDFARNDKAMTALGISAREYDVLKLLGEGYANKEIARHLNISPNTVKTHVTSLFTKLEVSRRTQAISKARELRILP